LLLFIASCNRREAPLPLASSAPVSPDRLQAGESLPGVQHVLGLEVPRGLHVAADFGDRAVLEGPLSLAESISALSLQLLPIPAEATATRITIEAATPKNGPPGKRLRIEATRRNAGTRVEVSDVTLPPVTQGLSEAERWKQAGRNPDGTPLDLSRVY
jgi:hypothetical protein